MLRIGSSVAPVLLRETTARLLKQLSLLKMDEYININESIAVSNTLSYITLIRGLVVP